MIPLGTLAAIISIVANGPTAWTRMKHMGHETVCVVRSGHRCAKKMLTGVRPVLENKKVTVQ